MVILFQTSLVLWELRNNNFIRIRANIGSFQKYIDLEMILSIYTDIEKPLHLKSSHILQISIKRLDKLTDEDMQHLLQFKGGTFIPEYLATDSASAEMNFPNARLMRFRRNYDRVGR